MSGGRPIAFRHVEDVLRLSREGGPAFDAPGQRVERLGQMVLLKSSSAASAKGRAAADEGRPLYLPLMIPGEVAVTPTRRLLARPVELDHRESCAVQGSRMQAFVRLDRCAGGLFVRNRRDGDRFRPLGSPGSRKLQDFFVDRKVPRQERDGVPLVVDRLDRIVWVAGHEIANEFRVTDPAQPMLILELKLSGGPA